MKIVMIVDDDLDIRDTLKDVLGDSGYEVWTAADGLEAMTQLRTRPPPDVILLDWMMPRCDGMQFRAMQLADPALAAIPVVLLTADVHLDSKRARLAARAYLAKPVTLDALLDVLVEICGT